KAAIGKRRDSHVLGVVGAIERERVDAAAAIERVVPVAWIPSEGVVAGEAEGRIVAGVAFEEVVTGAARQRVVAGTPIDVEGHVGARLARAVDDVVAAEAFDLNMLDVERVDRDISDVAEEAKAAI